MNKVVLNLNHIKVKTSFVALTPPRKTNFHIPLYVALLVAREIYGEVEIPDNIAVEVLQKRLTIAYETGMFDYKLVIG